VGPLGERQLLMMAALTLADELAEAGAERDRLQAEASGLRRERDALEARVVAALDAAARRIAALADPAGPQGTRLL
jgi:cell division protein ZapA (FtsZ GTPase activity inhibitor)